MGTAAERSGTLGEVHFYPLRDRKGTGPHAGTFGSNAPIPRDFEVIVVSRVFASLLETERDVSNPSMWLLTAVQQTQLPAAWTNPQALRMAQGPLHVLGCLDLGTPPRGTLGVGVRLAGEGGPAERMRVDIKSWKGLC